MTHLGGTCMSEAQDNALLFRILGSVLLGLDGSTLQRRLSAQVAGAAAENAALYGRQPVASKANAEGAGDWQPSCRP